MIFYTHTQNIRKTYLGDSWRHKTWPIEEIGSHFKKIGVWSIILDKKGDEAWFKMVLARHWDFLEVTFYFWFPICCITFMISINRFQVRVKWLKNFYVKLIRFRQKPENGIYLLLRISSVASVDTTKDIDNKLKIKFN